MVLIFLPFILSFLITIWLDTNVFIEYTDALKLYKYVPILINYYNIREQGGDSSFTTYLSQFYDGFFTRLITCEVCMATWLAIIGSTITLPYSLKYGFGFSIFYGLVLPYFVVLNYRILKRLK